MAWTLRKAVMGDREEIAALIASSVRGLATDVYTDEQIEHSIKSVFGVDDDLIRDETYFVAVDGERIVGCGGWSRRKTLFGASIYSESRDPGFLDPAKDAAKIRAFFIHPDFARQGIGSAILDRCEDEARTQGFGSAEMMATLPGVKLYEKRGYIGDEEVTVPVGNGIDIICIRMSKPL